MASKINYNNKAPFQTLEEIPDENKVNANDMNEIKTAVNNNADELDTAKEDIESLQNGQGTASTDITSLKNRTTALETDNTTNKQNIQNLQTENETNKSDIEELQTDNETNKTNITDLQNDKVDKVEGKGLSTEDFTTELKEKVEGLENYDDTEIKEDISNLEAEQTEQNEQIDILLNALPSETSEGENLNIKGTIPVKFKEFSVKGNSKQETRSGKNKFNNQSLEKGFIGASVGNKVTYSNSDTRVRSIENTSEKLKTSTEYKIICPENIEIGITIVNSALIVYSSTWLNNEQTFSTSSDSYDVIYTVRYSDNSNITVDEVKEMEIQIEEGPQATEYEPYGVMPSPEYPSPIQNVEGDVNATVSNKNLFKMPNKEETAFNNITYLAENQNIKINGTGTTGKYPWIIITKNNIYNKNGTPTLNDILQWQDGILAIGKITATLKRISGTSDWEINMNLYDESGEVVNNEIADTTKIVAIGLYLGNGKTFNNLILGIQIEKGEIATEYVEHQEQTVTFPLSEGQKLYKGDYLADDGIHHKRKQIELDGTEDWVLYTGYSNNAEKGYCYYLNITDCKIVRDTSISTHFKNVFGAYQESTGYVGAFSDNLTVKNKYFISDKETLEQFKTYLAQQKQAGTPVIVEYELAEEEIEAYTPEQQEAYNQLKQLTAYEEETNIYSTNGVSPVFSITAVKDINSVIEDTNAKIEAINELLSTTATSAMLLDNMQSDLESEVM